MTTQATMIAGEAAAKRAAEREALRGLIQQWNANRLDLFELSEPSEDLMFHGVMRFYFHDTGGHVTTKCIRVASDATVTAVIDTLIEKFRPDMRMLSVPIYALYVIHENGEERRLEPDEKPLLVQLNWHKDDREGRFLLKRIGDDTTMPAGTFQESSFKRKLSKREKKQLKKQEKLKRVKSTDNDEDGKVAEKLYTELPETSFTRSISNPEAVMRRRRHQKLERKLQQFRSKDGGPDTGGTLKIYGESLCGDVPYKTLLLSVHDSAAHVIREMLLKYGRDNDEMYNYCLVQVNTNDNSEVILDEDECPLAILMNHPSTSGSIMFHVRRRPADYHPRKRKKKPQQRPDYRYEDVLPYFLELNPDGSEIMSGTPKRHVLHPNVTEVGSERTGGPHLQLFGPNIQPRHCVIAHTDGLVTVTPCSRDSEMYVNGQRIFETSILQNGATVRFGRIHNFRFVDPTADDRGRPRQQEFAYDRLSKDDNTSTGTGAGANGTSNASNYETTFDVDGNVETVSLKDMDARSQRSIASSRDGNRTANYDRYPRGNDSILPAVLEVREETEDAFLHAIIIDLDHTHLTFKLSPTYVLYLTARYRASTHYRPELLPMERANRLTALMGKVAQVILSVIEERYTEPQTLAFWMANAAELLHFLKCDRHISAFSLDSQDTLADSVQSAFRHLVTCMQCELAAGMSSFLSERDDDDTILGILCNAMALLRICRVNAALTIQFFSHLFHFINMLAFNKIVTSPGNPQGVNYCSRAWGSRLKARVAQLGAWAERQGLELAASCHLGRLAEAAYLLEAPKYNVGDLAKLSSTCLKLNSIQLRALLRGYEPASDEPRLPLELIDNVVRVAENVADELARSDGREVKLEESPELQLGFLLPEDGFSCDVVRGMHQGLIEFIQSLQSAGLCRMSIQPTSSGVWTIYMIDPNVHLRSPSSLSNRVSSGQPPPEIQTIRLHKSNSGMGLSIVAAKGAGQDRLGIYIKSVVPGGAADVDSRLQAGDQLLKVDGHSLVGITQEKAAEYLVRTGPVVALEVAKQGAIYHGLATLLSQPSPLMARASKARRNSEYSDRQEGGPHPQLPSSFSMMNLQTRPVPPTGLAKGYPSPSPSYNGLPFPCIPNIVILDVDNAETASSSKDNDSDDPAKSVIFTKIQKVEYERGDNTPLTKEETDQCVAELKALVEDFEKCTRSEDLSIDLRGVVSDSECSDEISLDSSHQHLKLIRKQARFRRETQSLDSIPSVRDLTRKFDQYCSHDRLTLVDPKNDNRLDMLDFSKTRLSEGKVATLANYFSSLGEAGLIRFPISCEDEEPNFQSLSEPAINTAADAETQTSARSLSIPRCLKEAQVQTIQPDYDYSLIYSLLKLEKRKKFPKDYIRRRKTSKPKWHSVEALSPNCRSQFDDKKLLHRSKSQENVSPREKYRTRKKLEDLLDESSASVPNLVTHSSPEEPPRVLLAPRQRKALALPSPRRMSERDLPSRVQVEEMKQQLPPHLPIHGSKSVPSLHSVQNADQRQQEIFNPGYSRTSSSNSIPHTPLAFRSNQNLNEVRGQLSPGSHHPPVLHPAQSTPSLQNTTHPHQFNSTPNNGGYSGAPAPANHSNQQATPSNHHGYPTPPHHGSAYGNGPQSPTQQAYHPQQNYNGQSYQPSPGSQQTYPGYGHNFNSSTASHFPNTESQGSPQGSFHSSSQVDHAQQSGESERFYQNLAVYPHDLQRNRAPSAHDLSPGYVQRGPSATESIREKERPASAYLPHYHPQQQNQINQQGMSARSQSSRDMLREAKLQEMTEEVRRREQRGGTVPRGPLHPSMPRSASHSQMQQTHMLQIQQNHIQQNHVQQAHMQQMQQNHAQQMQQNHLQHSMMMQQVAAPAKPPVPEEYRETPPPPPPTSTHPLHQKAVSPDNRYQASTGEAPRGGYYPATQGDRRQYPYAGTNPWDREEKEKEQARRREAVRQWREKQVSDLSALPSRTPQQEEQLRALKLEREFERRAEEAKQEDEDENENEEETESSERVQGLLKMALQQNGPIIRPATASIAQMKLEDVRRQHAAGLNLNLKPSPVKSPMTLSNRPEMSHRLDPPTRPEQPHRPDQSLRPDPSQLRFDQLSINGPPSPSQYHQFNGHYEKQNGGVPAPPERGSSYHALNAASSPTRPTAAPPSKRVSFSDRSAPVVSPKLSPHMEKIVEDPNNFINENESFLLTPTTPDGQNTSGNTPGVIGAQEVYRDPRQRLLAEQKQNTAPRLPGPEKLSFKEKMKMFAMETGEDGTPRDKMIQRAEH